MTGSRRVSAEMDEACTHHPDFLPVVDLSQGKRKSSPGEEPPSKRPRVRTWSTSSEDSIVSVDQQSPRGSKRKADINTGNQAKRSRVCSKRKASASKPKDASVQAEQAVQKKRKASADNGTSKKKKRKASTDKDKPKKKQKKKKTSPEISAFDVSRKDFEAKYMQLQKLGERGFSCVYAGRRRADSLPLHQIPQEVALMQRAASGPHQFGMSPVVEFLDWYNLVDVVVIVMERPFPSINLTAYINSRGHMLKEDEAKNFMAQIVAAAIDMHDKGVFHRDIKTDNILVESAPLYTQLRIINFGCGSFEVEKPHQSFSGTVPFAPPEWHKLQSYKAEPTTVWQLGALLYRMLHPHQFDTLDFLNGKIKLTSWPSKECQDFFRRCLTIIPEDRATLQQLQLHPWLQ
uniref:serine/threonine-protein kinase pim-1-like n=1 Tax=Semicossyphus pulcher TaxID=241346 RepID=UPI0037E93B5F